MFDFLRQPYKENYTRKGKLMGTLSIGLFIFLFLFLFKPFGMSQVEASKQFFISLGYGLVTSFVVFIFSFLFAPFIITDQWTVGKNIIWEIILISCIGVANFFFYLFVFYGEFEIKHIAIYSKYLLLSIWVTLLVGIIPVTIRYLIYTNRQYKRALKDAAIPDVDIISWEEEIVIKAGNDRNSYSFNPKNIVFISSNDNYITVSTIKDDCLTKTHIRGTLKAVEYELKKNNQFLRCHKGFIVNLKYVVRTAGNVQNMKLILNKSDVEIPVSRTCVAAVLKKIRKD